MKKTIFRQCKDCRKGFKTTDKSQKYCFYCSQGHKVIIQKPKQICKPISLKPRIKPTKADKSIISNDFNVRRFVIFERDEFRCVYCGKSSIEDKAELHLEHIFPRSKGGNNDINNIVTSCQTCNLEKSSRQLSESVTIRLQIELINRNEMYFKDYDVKDLIVNLDKYYKYKHLEE